MGGAAWISRRGLRRGAAWLLAALLLASVAVSARAAAPGHQRTWELATPGPTNSVLFFSSQGWSDDGNRVSFTTVGALPGSSSGELLASALATRTPSGWVQQPLGVPFDAPATALFPTAPLAATPDLSRWLWSSGLPLLPDSPPSPHTGLYERTLDGTLTLRADAGASGFLFIGASEDLQHAVFDSIAPLVPEDAGRLAGAGAYELVGSQLRLVGVDDAGNPISACGSRIGSGSPTVPELGAVSRDGARVFFTAPDDPSCGEPQRVYLRENGATTTEISASACTRADCNAPQDVTFAGATGDGAHAFLVTSQQLTNDDVDGDPDLYRYDVADGQLTRLSAGAPGTSANLASTVVRTSEDGMRVYFLATGQLIPGEGAQDTPTIYLSDHGTLRFVASVTLLDPRTIAVSADGRVLAFSTTSALTPGDIDGHSDVYRYDADGGTLENASAGADGLGNGEFSVTFSGSPLQTLVQQPQRYMSADGRHILFITSEQLVPEDRNATDDVYEWADGTVGLVSSGAPAGGALVFGGVSADGRSVFFSTDESLVAADRDGGDEDLYVARLDGGFPAAPPPPAPCDGDACQGPLPGGRLAQREPATLGYAEPPAERLRVHAPGAKARRQLAATGRLTLAVDAPLAGRVSATARARIGGRSRVVAAGAASASHASLVRLRLRLSAAARRALRRSGALHVTLTVRHSRLDAAQTIALDLRSGS